MKLLKKVLKIIGLVLGGAVFLYVGWFTFWYIYEMGEDEVYILPNNFEGAVIVLMNEPDGTTKKYNKKGDRVYEIPESGVLKTQFKFQDGRRAGFKFKRKNGTELRYLWPPDKVWDDTINVNSIYKDSIYVLGAGYADDFYFIVGKPTQRNSLWKEMDKKWEPYNPEPMILKGKPKKESEK